MEAGRMLAAGESIERVAKLVGTTTQTVSKYKKILDSGGLDALKHLSVGGRKSALDAEARQWIADTVRQSPRAHGFDTERWSNPKLLDAIERKFGVRYSDVYVRQLTIDLGLLTHMQPRKAPVKRPPGVLDNKAMAWIAAALRDSPRAFGFDADQWKNERLRSLIEKQFGVRYSSRYVWQIATRLGLGHVLTKIRK
jgi:transposase